MEIKGSLPGLAPGNVKKLSRRMPHIRTGDDERRTDLSQFLPPSVRADGSRKIAPLGPAGFLPCLEFASAEYGSPEVRQMFFHLGKPSFAGFTALRFSLNLFNLGVELLIVLFVPITQGFGEL